MATHDTAFPNRPFILRTIVEQQSQNINENYSTIIWRLEIHKTANSTPWSNNPSSWAMIVDGTNWSGTFTYDYRNLPVGSGVVIAQSSKNVWHSSDGSKQFVYTSAADVDGLGSTGLPHTTFTATTIPRASQPSVSNQGGLAGSQVTISTNRASTAFTHRVRYGFGNVEGVIATGVATSVVWTIPLSLINQIPNATTGVGSIYLDTYQGSSLVGSKSVNWRLNVGEEHVPTIGSVTDSESVSSVQNQVGKYVQGVSRLNLAMSGVAGVYSSTISARKLTVAGQVLNAGSGVTGPIMSAGGSVPILAEVTDSRGRKASLTKEIEVLPYAPPMLNSVTAQRSLANGALADEGTNIRVNINAAVASLMNGTQRNILQYKVSSRARGESAWTLHTTAQPSGISYNNFYVITNRGIEDAWEVLVEVSDLFSTSTVQLTVPTAAIFQHWDGKEGMGVGKYRQNGMLDVLGSIYHRDGGLVDPAGSIMMFAGENAPAGWLICAGQTVSRTEYANLFSVLGTTYGAGNGSTTFTLPNLRGRFPVGLNSAETEFNALGKTGGSKTHQLTESELPSHTHPAQGSELLGNGGTGTTYGIQNGTFFSFRGNTTTGSRGGNQPHNNLPPYMAINFIIKT